MKKRRVADANTNGDMATRIEKLAG